MTYGEAALSKQDTLDVYFYVMDVVAGRELNVLTPGERIFALSDRLIGQVCNGGFDQYFFNGGVVDVHEAARGFATIGAVQAERLVRRAIEIARIPEPVPAAYDYYNQLTEEIRRQLHGLDQEFYSAALDEDEIYPCLVRYLQEHTEEFS